MSEQTQQEQEWLQFIRTAGLEMTDDAGNNVSVVSRPRLSFSFGDVANVVTSNLKASNQAFEDHQNDMRMLDGGDTIVSGRMRRTIGSGITEAELKEKEEREFFQSIFQISLEDQIKWHGEMALWHEEQAKILRDKIAENTEKQNEHYAYAEKFNDILEEYNKTKRMDKDQVWRLLKERGISIDKSADASVFSRLIEYQKAEELKKGQKYDEFNQILDADAKKHETEASQHRKAEQCLNEINNSDLSDEEKEIERKQETEKGQIYFEKKDFLTAAESIRQAEEAVFVDEPEADEAAHSLSMLQNAFGNANLAQAPADMPVPEENKVLNNTLPLNANIFD